MTPGSPVRARAVRPQYGWSRLALQAHTVSIVTVSAMNSTASRREPDRRGPVVRASRASRHCPRLALQGSRSDEASGYTRTEG